MKRLDQLAQDHRIADDWVDALRAADSKIDEKVDACLTRVANASPALPAPDRIWRAFEIPLADVRVLIVGKDPYPNTQHAVGLSFSTGPGGPIPGSLINIYAELAAEGFTVGDDGDLTPWTDAGVMLLNRALTLPGSAEARPRTHLGWWRPLIVATARAIAADAARRPIASILWGVPAQRLGLHLGPQVKVLSSSHPSMQSASRPAGGHPPFQGSRPFSRVNGWLSANGEQPIEWNLAT